MDACTRCTTRSWACCCGRERSWASAACPDSRFWSPLPVCCGVQCAEVLEGGFDLRLVDVGVASAEVVPGCQERPVRQNGNVHLATWQHVGKCYDSVVPSFSGRTASFTFSLTNISVCCCCCRCSSKSKHDKKLVWDFVIWRDPVSTRHDCHDRAELEFQASKRVLTNDDVVNVDTEEMRFHFKGFESPFGKSRLFPGLDRPSGIKNLRTLILNKNSRNRPIRFRRTWVFGVSPKRGKPHKPLWTINRTNKTRRIGQNVKKQLN